MNVVLFSRELTKLKEKTLKMNKRMSLIKEESPKLIEANKKTMKPLEKKEDRIKYKQLNKKT